MGLSVSFCSSETPRAAPTWRLAVALDTTQNSVINQTGHVLTRALGLQRARSGLRAGKAGAGSHKPRVSPQSRAHCGPCHRPEEAKARSRCHPAGLW